MAFRGLRFLNKRFLIIALLASVASAGAGCGYLGFYTGKAHWRTTFEYMPTMSALNRLAPEDSLVLSGQIVKLQQRQEPLLLAAVSNQYRRNEKVALVQLPASGDAYTTFLPEGEYELFVFADLDKNRDFESNERIGGVRVSVSPEHSRGGVVVSGPSITVDFDRPAKVDFHLSETVRPTGYVYSSLDDEIFDPKYGPTGLYNPSELVARTQGFLFGLEDYREDKTLVLFVHGISGTPRDWKYFVDGLDRSRFQPFFFYYPSGLPLDRLGTLLAQLIENIDKTKNGECRIVLVAHSMGGLVALSAINKLSEVGLPAALRLYCTFSTPYAGDEVARKGIEMAPVVVPVWRDIAADSEFLRDLTSRPFPEQLPFYLFFSYHDSMKFKLGESSDGSVTLRSQLVPSLQSAAVKVIGFNETHVGILNSPETRESFLRLLDTVTPPRQAHVKGE